MKEDVTEIAQEYLQTFPVEVLAEVAKGNLDLNFWAHKELANRGLDKNGKWVGFIQANRERYGMHD